MLFGLSAADTKKPKILNLQAYALNDSSHVNASNIALPIKLKEIERGKYITDQIQGYGLIGFGVNTYDQLNGALNKNGVYKIEMSVNGKTIYEHLLEKFVVIVITCWKQNLNILLGWCTLSWPLHNLQDILWELHHCCQYI